MNSGGDVCSKSLHMDSEWWIPSWRDPSFREWVLAKIRNDGRDMMGGPKLENRSGRQNFLPPVYTLQHNTFSCANCPWSGLLSTAVLALLNDAVGMLVPLCKSMFARASIELR